MPDILNPAKQNHTVISRKISLYMGLLDELEKECARNEAEIIDLKRKIADLQAESKDMSQ